MAIWVPFDPNGADTLGAAGGDACAFKPTHSKQAIKTHTKRTAGDLPAVDGGRIMDDRLITRTLAWTGNFCNAIIAAPESSSFQLVHHPGGQRGVATENQLK